MRFLHLLAALLPVSALAAGALDPSFGTGGRASFDFTPTAAVGEHGNKVAIQPDGKLLALSQTTGTPKRVVVSRHMPDGSLDVGFGVGGKVIVDFGTCPTCQITGPDIGLQFDGSIIVAATETGENLLTLIRSGNIVVTRLTPAGVVDTL